MNKNEAELDQGVTTSAANYRRRSLWCTPRWQVALVVTVNALVIPLVIPIFLLEQSQPFLARYFFGPPVLGMVFAEVFLLAIWMAVGGWPRTYRSILVSALGAIGAFSLALVVVVIQLVQDQIPFTPDVIIKGSMVLVGAPIICVIVIWVVNALFIIPAWYYGITIDFAQTHTFADRPIRTFGIPQIFLWMIQLSIPLAILQLLIQLTEEPNAAIGVLLPFVTVLICCPPIAFAGLMSKLSAPVLAGVAAWVAFVLALHYFLPVEWGPSDMALWLFWCCVIEAINIAWLRYLGLRWLPHEPRADHPPTESSLSAPSLVPRN